MRSELQLTVILGIVFCLISCDDAKPTVSQADAQKMSLKTNVKHVLEQDAKTHVGVQSANQAVAGMRAIDTTNCPADFRATYLSHIHAWETMADVERDAIAFKATANSDGVLVESLIRGYLGDPLVKANEIQAAQSQLQQKYLAARLQVKQTFNRVETIALHYGATTPKGK